MFKPTTKGEQEIRTRGKIGEVLLGAGVITSAQLEQALWLQKEKKKRLGRVLIELGYAGETHIAEVLSSQLNIPLVSNLSQKINPELARIVSRETAEEKLIIPLEKGRGKLTLAMADPFDLRTIDEIAFSTGFVVCPCVATETDVLEAVEKTYSSEKIWDLLKTASGFGDIELVESGEERELVTADKLNEDAPAVKLVTLLMGEAVKARASDIHIEPMEKFVQVRYRIDGELQNALKYPKSIQEAVISRVKILSNLDITNRRKPQDGRAMLKIKGRDPIDLRISTMPSVHGEKVVIRILDSSAGLIPLGQLGIPDRIINEIIRTVSRPQGMLLVTGPTGSGKTTTLYAILKQLQSERENLVTIEDPVEYRLPGITQTGINEAAGLTFASVLRSILRQDPDTIFVGEIRDLETAEIALRAAFTGHLVFSTLHTLNTVSTVTRLLDIGLEPCSITSALSAVIAQRLVRRLCTKCMAEDAFPEEFAALKPTRGGPFYRAIGCKECQYTGYKGQVGAYEMLTLDNQVKRLIYHGAPEEELWHAARENGIKTLFEDAWEKAASGLTSIEEVMTKVGPENAFAGQTGHRLKSTGGKRFHLVL